MLIYLKRSSGELASYQQKMFRIDDHIGIAIAGLTSDARVLRYKCLSIYRSENEASCHLQQLHATAGNVLANDLQSPSAG